ncbi:MAG TPA: hypothetical protein VLA49_16925 [Anaerolineales bacterium]|nr:hypothetical protein [Anaerolineales bacterium]
MKTGLVEQEEELYFKPMNIIGGARTGRKRPLTNLACPERGYTGLNFPLTKACFYANTWTTGFHLTGTLAAAAYTAGVFVCGAISGPRVEVQFKKGSFENKRS